MTMNPENPSNENEYNVQCGITRRSFIKRTSATVVVTVLALHAFRNEACAQDAGASSLKWPIQLVLLEGSTEFFTTETDPEGFPPGRYRRSVRFNCDPVEIGTLKPAPSLSASIGFVFTMQRSTDEGATWTDFGGGSTTTTFSAANGAYPKRGPVTGSADPAGQFWFGNSTIGVQIAIIHNEGLMSIKFNVSVMWLLIDGGGPNDTNIIHNTGIWEFGPDDQNITPPPMWYEGEETVLSFEEGSGRATFVEISE